jgi:hypothetical protein
MSRRLLATVLVVGSLFDACGGQEIPSGEEAQAGPGERASTGTFVSLSDVHFDPFYDPALFAELMVTEASGWSRVFEGSTKTEIAPAGADSNYNLFASALRAAREVAPDPDFVIYPGDFLVHGFEKKFQDALGGLATEDVPGASDCRSSESQPLECFIDRTIEFFSLM